MNAGAGMYLAGKAGTIRDGIALAAELIDAGMAKDKLREFIAASKEGGAPHDP